MLRFSFTEILPHLLEKLLVLLEMPSGILSITINLYCEMNFKGKLLKTIVGEMINIEVLNP
jgi:hypothetical protein